MNKIFLNDFIKTGKLGPLEIGDSKADIIDFFGEDYDFGDCGETHIIKYGWWEFFYWAKTEKLYAIQNDHLSFDCLNHDEMISLKTKKVEMDTWFIQPNQQVTFKDVQAVLKKENIEFKIDKYSPKDELNILRLKNGITIDFNDEQSRWTMDEITKKMIGMDLAIENPAAYLLNGIRLFRY